MCPTSRVNLQSVIQCALRKIGLEIPLDYFDEPLVYINIDTIDIIEIIIMVEKKCGVIINDDVLGSINTLNCLIDHIVAIK